MFDKYLIEKQQEEMRAIARAANTACKGHRFDGHVKMPAILDRDDVTKSDFPAKVPDFCAKRQKFPLTIKYAESAYFCRIQIRYRRWHGQTSPCASSSEFHDLPCDCLVTDKDIPTILYLFRGVFSVCCHAQANILGPAAFKIAAIGFNNSSCVSLVLRLHCHSSASMPARPDEAAAQEPVYEHKELYGPDGNRLSKCARLYQPGLNCDAVASPVHQQKVDRLTGTQLQAIVSKMRMSGKSLRVISSIT
jgi:hypothetical protein